LIIDEIKERALDKQVKNCGKINGNSPKNGKFPEKAKIIIDSTSKLTFLKPSSSFSIEEEKNM